ncbi:LysM peptidoglycan-binding domain-containing protein [Metabacillus sp. 84]|uniref:LysM peptidoglycan-binding domain-containing protein n=1 Tax=Metabacillus sp. 84 TaxID=3404705 RepID=UPI003CEE71FF
MRNQKNPPDQAENLRDQMIPDKEQYGQYPSRSEVHKSRYRAKDKKKKVKLKYPLISFLALCFILLPVLFLFVTYYYDKDGTPLDNGQNLKDYESIIIDNNREAEPAESGTGSDAAEDIRPEEPEQSSPDKSSYDSSAEAAVEQQSEIGTPAPEKKDESQAAAKEDSPGKEETEAGLQKDKKAKPPKQSVQVVKHVVKPKENLYRISLKYFKSRVGEEIIKDHNQLSANEVYAGQVLEIPLKQ